MIVFVLIETGSLTIRSLYLYNGERLIRPMRNLVEIVRYYTSLYFVRLIKRHYDIRKMFTKGDYILEDLVCDFLFMVETKLFGEEE